MIAHSVVASPFHCSVNFENVTKGKLSDRFIGEDRDFPRYHYKICPLEAVENGQSGVIDDLQSGVIDDPGTLDNFGFIQVAPVEEGKWKISVSFYGKDQKLLRQKLVL